MFLAPNIKAVWEGELTKSPEYGIYLHLRHHNVILWLKSTTNRPEKSKVGEVKSIFWRSILI